MGATSATGVSGAGVAGKATINEVSQWMNGPQIYVSGIVHSEGAPASPPADFGGRVTFPTPLPGLGGVDWCVILTSIGGGAAYAALLTDDDLDGDGEDDHFTGFTAITDSEADVMYIVVKVGQRPNPVIG